MSDSSLLTSTKDSPPPRRVSKSLYVPVVPNIIAVISSILLTTPPLFYLITNGCRGFVTELHNRPCISDGSRISELFSVNMAFGNYSFTTVKIIDTIWNIAVARGLQIALAAGALAVYKMALMRAMESYTMSYDLFLATRVQQGTFSICSALIHELIRRCKTQNRPLHVKAILATILVTTAYIGVWPTLTSAMTGYTPRFTTMVAACDGSAIPTAYYSTSRIIYDGQRISLTARNGTQFSNSTSRGATLWKNTVLTAPVGMTVPTNWEVSLAIYDCEANSGILDPPSGIRVDVDLCKLLRLIKAHDMALTNASKIWKHSIKMENTPYMVPLNRRYSLSTALM